MLVEEFEDLNIPMHGVRLPTFEVKKEHKDQCGATPEDSNYEFLRKLCLKGFRELKIPKDDPKYKIYVDRVKHELGVMEKLGFVDYILMVWDIINFCRENEIPLGPARGSCASSLVLFLIKVTSIDPLKYNLYFERFISEVRARKQIIDGVTYLDGKLMCDVDMDICYYRRGEVLKYLGEKYKGRTAKIKTLNTLSGKLLIKECGKIVADKPEHEMTYVTGLISERFGKVQDLEKAYQETLEFKTWCDENKLAYNIALKLRGLIKNHGVHPSGVAVSFDSIEDSCPLEITSDKEAVTAFDMNWTSLLMVKVDVLGSRGVSVAQDACNTLGLTFDDIDVNDPCIYQSLQDFRYSHGIFQLEADTNKRVCNKVMPRNLEHLSAVLALARPGALQFVDQYAGYVNNGVLEGDSTGSPKLDAILAETGNAILYQETLMRIAHEVFELSLLDAETIRRVVGKKLSKEMAPFEEKIKEQGRKLGIESAADFYWKSLLASADYSFNFSHSISYATLAAITLYLKFKYPKEFYLSLLKMTRFEPDPISEIGKVERELHNFGIKLLPPHLLKSEFNFKIEGDDIRFGLLSVKGISDKSIEKLSQFKTAHSNKFEIFRGAEEAGVNSSIISALIQAGALEDEISISRARVVAEWQLWHILGEKEKRRALELGAQYNYDLFEIYKAFKTKELNEKGEPFLKEKRIETIKKKFASHEAIYAQNSKNQKLANWYYEKKLLGYSATQSLHKIFSEKYPELELRTISDIKDNAEMKEEVSFIGTVVEKKDGIAKNAKKTRYLRFTVQDESDKIDVLFFNENIDEVISLNHNSTPNKDDIVFVRGRKKEKDSIFGDVIKKQNIKIYMKLMDSKKDNKD